MEGKAVVVVELWGHLVCGYYSWLVTKIVQARITIQPGGNDLARTLPAHLHGYLHLDYILKELLFFHEGDKLKKKWCRWTSKANAEVESLSSFSCGNGYLPF